MGEGKVVGEGNMQRRKGYERKIERFRKEMWGKGGVGWLGINGVREMTQQRWLDWGGVCLEIARWWL